LGTAVALTLEAGVVPIRKAGSIHPGEKATRQAAHDSRGNETVLRVQRGALQRTDRVLLVDDWAETGNQAYAARSLIEECGASYVGLSLLVDQLSREARHRLEPVRAVVIHNELPPSA
jgi:adenine phosphoribosyltransferase